MLRVLLLLSITCIDCFSALRVSSLRIAQRQQTLSRKRYDYAKAQLDHKGTEDFFDLSPSKNRHIYKDDDEILAAIEAKLEQAQRMPMAKLLGDVHTLVDDEAMDESSCCTVPGISNRVSFALLKPCIADGVHLCIPCPLIADLLPEVSTSGSLTHYFICSQPPEDNENLICEQQADGLDWVCKSTWSP